MISPGEKKQILFAFNDTAADYPQDKTIQELFAARAEKTPGNTAIVGPGFDIGTGAGVGAKHSELEQDGNASPLQPIHLTYRQLNKTAGFLSGVLVENGVCPGDIVAIMVDRSLEMMIGIFAVLEAGGAYLPVSPHYPEERKKFMLRDSGAKLLLTTRSLKKEVEKFRSLEVENIFIDDRRGEPCVRQPGKTTVGARRAVPSEPATCNLQPVTSPSNLAYVIYTSGSTGKPKGVMIEHPSLVNRLHWMQKKYPINENDTLLQKTPYFFDVSVWELFWWSMTGARLCFLPPGVEKFPQAIIEAVARNRVTVIHFVPSMLSTFLEYLRGKDEEIRRLKSLKRVFASGETLAPSHLRAFNEILYKTNATQLTNLYGPTEATVDVSYFDCSPGENLERIPIGRPIDNINLHVLDENLELQAIGEKGELCIAGVGLSRGYLNKPELTAEKFVTAQAASFKPQAKETAKSIVGARRAVPSEIPEKTFVNNKSFLGGPGGPTCVGKRLATPRQFPEKESMVPLMAPRAAGLVAEGIKLYKTGDLARWLPDGNIEFLGRMDHQVKIRGLRIELGEIEAVLLNHAFIRDCVVSLKKYSENIVIIVAYILSRQEVSAQQLKEYLKKILPDYMIPGSFVFMDCFPATPGGKVDRKALPEPQL